MLKTDSIVVFKDDLNVDHQHLNFDDIELNHLRLKLCDIHKSPIIIYIDENMNSRIIKNRFGKINYKKPYTIKNKKPDPIMKRVF